MPISATLAATRTFKEFPSIFHCRFIEQSFGKLNVRKDKSLFPFTPTISAVPPNDDVDDDPTSN
jgi:hypothetical protein